MMRIWISMVVLAAACKKELPPPANELEAFERKYVADYEFQVKALRSQGREIDDKDIPTSYRAVYIGGSGVYVDRKLVATLSEVRAKRAELAAAIDANEKLLPTIGITGLVVTFDLGPEPASTAIDVLRLFANREPYFEKRYDDPEFPMRASQILCSKFALRETPDVKREPIEMSVLVDKASTWIGLSQLNEFQEIPNIASAERDFEKLKTALRYHRASEPFKDRNDVELAATGGTAGDILTTFEMLCREGFNDIALIAPEQLSAHPSQLNRP